MHHIDTLVIGAGHAGLAMSRSLTDRSLDHIVLERGRLAERWRTERWDSLRLLTPNWMTRLPGWAYDGNDPDGYMTAAQVTAYLERYATSFGAPVELETAVEAIQPVGERLVVTTSRGTWNAGQVVMATGSERPHVPLAAAGLSPSVHQTTAGAYRNPSGLPDGGVLVVGAGASGVQIADELARAGRDVVLAVGRHSRLPRRYRGRDIWWWLDRIGTLDKTIDQMRDPQRALREPSLQLAGRRDSGELNLAALRQNGVRIAGHLTGTQGSTVHFASDLAETTARAEARMRRVLARIDATVAAAPGHARGCGVELADMAAIRPVRVVAGPGRLDLAAEQIRTVVWATGLRRSYGWLRLPVVDAAGELRHHHGITPFPGLYVIGERFQHRRRSSLIDGARHDAELLTDHIASRAARHQLAV